MAMGHTPFIGENYISILHSILYHPHTSFSLGFPDSLANIILRCLEKKPAHRFASATELRRELDAFIRQTQRP